MNHYALFKKSCTTSSGYIPVRSTDCKLFEAPFYLMAAFKYNKAIQAKCTHTLSKGGKHLSSLFQHKNGPWYYGDTGQDALLVMMDGLQMEVFLFPDQRSFSEALYLGVDKLPLSEIRLKAKPVNKSKYERQLTCYDTAQQLSFLK